MTHTVEEVADTLPRWATRELSDLFSLGEVVSVRRELLNAASSNL